MEEKLFNEIKEKALPFFKDYGGHAFDHTERVLNLAKHIAKNENVDIDIVVAAALLHDIARCREDDGKIGCHAEQGAKDAEALLKETSFPKEKIKAVVHAVAVHRYSTGIVPDSLEGKIIQDADRLEALGAIAVARIFARGGEMGRPFYKSLDKYDKEHKTNVGGSLGHFSKKIFKIKPKCFYTKTARDLAVKRYKFTEIFVQEFLDEVSGKR